MTIIRWRLDVGGTYDYTFPRNPDRHGGDNGWTYEPRMSDLYPISSNTPLIQVDGFRGARRNIKFSAITGDMVRTLQNFYLRAQIIYNCRDHLYPTTLQFDMFIDSFSSSFRPVYGVFPGSDEDTYDVEMTMIRIN